MAEREKLVPVGFRLPESVIERIDAFAASQEQPGQIVSRSNAVRMLIERGLSDAGLGPKTKRRKGRASNTGMNSGSSAKTVDGTKGSR